MLILENKVVSSFHGVFRGENVYEQALYNTLVFLDDVSKEFMGSPLSVGFADAFIVESDKAIYKVEEASYYDVERYMLSKMTKSRILETEFNEVFDTYFKSTLKEWDKMVELNDKGYAFLWVDKDVTKDKQHVIFHEGLVAKLIALEDSGNPDVSFVATGDVLIDLSTKDDDSFRIQSKGSGKRNIEDFFKHDYDLEHNQYNAEVHDKNWIEMIFEFDDEDLNYEHPAEESDKILEQIDFVFNNIDLFVDGDA